MSHKKAILFISFLAVFGSLFCLNVPTAKAVTLEELQTQIQVIQTQIASLQQQLAQVQGGTTTWCYDFNVNLKYGMRSAKVEALQTALIKEGFTISQSETSAKYFSESTASAVVGFQEKYASEILTPLKLQHGTGYGGVATRTKLNKLYGCAITVVAPETVSYPPIKNVNLGIGERILTITDWRTIIWEYGVVPAGTSRNVDIHLVVGEGNAYDKLIASNIFPIAAMATAGYGYSWRVGYLQDGIIAPEGSNYSIRVCPIGVSVSNSNCSSLTYSFALKSPTVDTRNITSAGLDGSTTAILGESRIIKWQIGGTGWATNVADRKVDIWSSEILGANLGYAHLIAAGVSPTLLADGSYSYNWRVGSFQNTSFFISNPQFGIAVCPAGTTSSVYCTGDLRTYTLISSPPQPTTICPPEYKVLFVSEQTGNDNNNGLIEQTPVKTLDKAKEIAKNSRDEKICILLKAGEVFKDFNKYSDSRVDEESLKNFAFIWDLDKELFLGAYGTGKAILGQEGNAGKGFAQAAIAILGATKKVTISGLYFRKWQTNAIFVKYAKNVEIKENIFENIGTKYFPTESNNELYYAPAVIYLKDSEGILAKNNEFKNIHNIEKDSAKLHIFYITRVKNSNIFNNFIIYASGPPLKFRSTTTGITVESNKFYYTGDVAGSQPGWVRVSKDSSSGECPSDITIKGNIFHYPWNKGTIEKCSTNDCSCNVVRWENNDFKYKWESEDVQIPAEFGYASENVKTIESQLASISDAISKLAEKIRALLGR